MRVSSDLALIRTICNLRLIIKSVSNLKVLMGLTEELFECNFMTATKGNFLGLTKLLTPWIICFTKCTSHWKQSQWRRDSFPHFSAPLLTTVPNKRQLVRLLWRDNDECGETWIFSPWEDIFVQTFSTATISSKHSGSLFVLSGSYRAAKCCAIKWLTPNSLCLLWSLSDDI